MTPTERNPASASARRWIRLDFQLSPGERVSPPEAPPVFAAGPEAFFLGLLAERMNAAMVFVGLHGVADRLDPEVLRAVDERLAAAYWDDYLGVLTPPPVLRLLRRLGEGPSGAMCLGMLEDARLDLFDTEDLESGAEVHADARAQFLLAGAHDELTDEQVAGGELLTDYLFLQRAIAWDIQQAEKDRAPGETRAAAADRLDKGARFTFEKAITQVMQTRRVIDRIPPQERLLVEAFARRRRQFAQAGVLASLAGR